MHKKSHWETVYTTKESSDVSWFQPHAVTSLEFINRLNCEKSVAIIDVGGGASTLVDDLLLNGHTNLTVLDLSGAALATIGVCNHWGQILHCAPLTIKPMEPESLILAS